MTGKSNNYFEEFALNITNIIDLHIIIIILKVY